jgi:acetyltransferase-like isoleucine patch superfamily enzyme
MTSALGRADDAELPPRARAAPGRLRQAAGHPLWAARQAGAVARARWDLRGCQRLGPRARLFGRCRVTNYATIEIGERLLMYGDPVRCDLDAHEGGTLEIGDRVFLNYGCSISAHTLVRIGDGCLIGQYTIVMDCDHHDPEGSEGHGSPRPIVIGDRVWMGARVTVLKGVTIGTGSVIGAGSVVTRDIPPGVLAAGAPARVIKPVQR